MPGCRVAGVPGGVYNRTICRSLSRTREVRRSANQIGIPPLVHCHKMAALNQPDSAYRAPPPEAPLAARHEKLRLSIHFYRSCFSVSLSRTSLALTGTRARSFPSSAARPILLFFYLPPPSLSRLPSPPPLSATPRLARSSTSPLLFNNRSSLFHRAPYGATVSIRVSPRYRSPSPLADVVVFLLLHFPSFLTADLRASHCIPQTKSKFDNCKIAR